MRRAVEEFRLCWFHTCKLCECSNSTITKALRQGEICAHSVVWQCYSNLGLTARLSKQIALAEILQMSCCKKCCTHKSGVASWILYVRKNLTSYRSVKEALCEVLQFRALQDCIFNRCSLTLRADSFGLSSCNRMLEAVFTVSGQTVLQCRRAVAKAEELGGIASDSIPLHGLNGQKPVNATPDNVLDVIETEFWIQTKPDPSENAVVMWKDTGVNSVSSFTILCSDKLRAAGLRQTPMSR